mgnify:CR=1 FL=1
MNKFAKRILFLSLALGVAVGLFWYVNTYIYQFLASTDPVSVAMIPSKERIDLTGIQSEEFNVAFQVAQQDVSGMQLILSYDGKYIQYGKEYSDSGFIPQTGVAYEVVHEEVVSSEGTELKKVTIVLVSTEAIPPTPNNSRLLNFKFRVRVPEGGDEVFQDRIQEIKLEVNSEFVGSTSGGEATSFSSPTDPVIASIALFRGTATTPIPEVSPATPTPIQEPTPTMTVTPLEATPTEPPPTPTAPPDTPTPLPLAAEAVGVSLQFRARFQGIIDQPNGDQKQLSARISIQSSKGTKSEQTITFTPESRGIWKGETQTFSISADESFSIKIKGQKHLSRKICDLQPTESVPGTYKCLRPAINFAQGSNVVDLSGIILLAGDIPQQDGIVDARDIVYIRQNFSNTGEERLVRGDLNLDGIVDTQDYVLVMSALSFKYDE